MIKPTYLKIFGRRRNIHRRTTEDVRGPNHTWIPNTITKLLRFLDTSRFNPFRLLDPFLVQHPREFVTIFRAIDGLGTGSCNELQLIYYRQTPPTEDMDENSRNLGIHSFIPSKTNYLINPCEYSYKIPPAGCEITPSQNNKEKPGNIECSPSQPGML